jgi:hypothetical protein
VVLILVEGLGTIPHDPMPSAPPTLSTVAAPYLVLPTHEVVDMNMMLWSTDRFATSSTAGVGWFRPRPTRSEGRSPDSRMPAEVAYLRSVGGQDGARVA